MCAKKAPPFSVPIRETATMRKISRELKLKKHRDAKSVLAAWDLVQESLFDADNGFDESLTRQQVYYRQEAEKWASRYIKYSKDKPLSCANTAYRRIRRSEVDYLKFFDYLEKFEVIAVDIETTGLALDADKARGVEAAEILSIQFATEHHSGFLLEWPLIKASAKVQERLYKILSSRDWCTVFHNMKFDIPFIARDLFEGWPRRIRAEREMFLASQDTQLMAYVALGEVAVKKGRGNKKEGGLKLKNLVRKYLQMDMTDFDRLGRLDIHTTSGLVYSCRDVDATLQLFDYIMSVCPVSLYPTMILERNAVIGILEYERHGILIHRDIVQQFKFRILQDLQEVEDEIRAYPEFKTLNLGSQPQVAHILYNVYKIPVTEFMKTDKGAPSVDEETLRTIQHFHPSIIKLVEHRKLSTLLKMYTDMILDKTAKAPYLYPSVLQTSTRTGRLSEEDPNLQQVQKIEVAASEPDAKFLELVRGINFRIVFGARPGNILLKADYGGQEIVVAAFLSKCPMMRKLILEGHDIHAAMAIQVNKFVHEGVTLEPFNKAHQTIVKKYYKQYRTDVKPVTFGIFYGITKYSLSLDILNDQDRARIFGAALTAEHEGLIARGFVPLVNDRERSWSWSEAPGNPPATPEALEAARASVLGCLREDEMNKVRDRAQGYIDSFYELFPTFKKYQSKTVWNAKQSGEVHTLLGRVRKLDLDGYGWANQAKNTPIQGTCADIIKYVSYRLALALEPYDARLLLTVHDEIVIECALECKEEVKKIMADVMNEHILPLYPGFDLPLGVEVDEHVNWGWTVEAFEKYMKIMLDEGNTAEVEWLQRFVPRPLAEVEVTSAGGGEVPAGARAVQNSLVV